MHDNSLSIWFGSPPGRRLQAQENILLSQVLPHLFGYHLLQIGCFGQGQLLESSRIRHRVILSTTTSPCSRQPAVLHCEANCLPIASDSVDVVLLPHVLEFERYPHEVLREVERVLIPDGHVVLTGFNPLGLWGVRRLFTTRKNPPWCGRFRTLLRIRDWLRLLGFEIMIQKPLAFPDVTHAPLSKGFYLKQTVQKTWSHVGSVYLVVAKKKVSTLTPIKPKWRAQTVISGAVGSPGARRQFSMENQDWEGR